MRENAPVRMRMRHLSRRLTTVDGMLLIAAILPSIIETTTAAADGRASAIAAGVTASLCLAAACAIAKTNAAWLFVLVWTVANVLPEEVSVSATLPVLVAVALIARMSLLQGVVAAVICTFAESNVFIEKSLHALSMGSLLSIGSTFMIAAVVGAFWGGANRHAAYEQKKMEAEWERERSETADHLHNSIVNDLVYIIFLEQQASKKIETEPAAAPVCHDELEQISRAATEALTDARTIISAMHAAHVDDNGHATPPVGKRVDINFGELGRTHDERLAKTGIIGTTIIGAVLPRRLPRESGIVVLAALDEIYSNIMKHADHEKGYCVTISSANMQLHITVADTPAVEQADAPLSAGSGIAQCERSVRAIGGTVTLHEGTPWTMGISIPLTRQMSA